MTESEDSGEEEEVNGSNLPYLPPSPNQTKPSSPSTPKFTPTWAKRSRASSVPRRGTEPQLEWAKPAHVADWTNNRNTTLTEDAPIELGKESPSTPTQEKSSTPTRKVHNAPGMQERRHRYAKRYGHRRCKSPEGTLRARPASEIPLTEEAISPIKRDCPPVRKLQISDVSEEE